jgi:hypothetical protein
VNVAKILVVASLLLSACDMRNAEDKPENYNSESVEAGVIVHGYTSPGWIQNTNPYPVRVKEVWIFDGETTDWVETLQPGEKIPSYISHQNGFHIYTMDGIEVGWIRPYPNGQRLN